MYSIHIKEFYPSISEKALKDATNFAKQFTNVSKEDERLINHCRKSLLFKDNCAWKKKDIKSSFDVTMGSYDGAEICELIGCHILSDLQTLPKIDDAGLYRDDGIILIRNLVGRDVEVLRKQIVKCMKSFGFSIEITASIKVANFLDVTFDLANEIYSPYKKPNDNILYVHTSSNHPPNILKQIPDAVSKRLSRNSSSEEIFNQHKDEYVAAIKSSGYKESLKFTANMENTQRRN